MHSRLWATSVAHKQFQIRKVRECFWMWRRAVLAVLELRDVSEGQSATTHRQKSVDEQSGAPRQGASSEGSYLCWAANGDLRSMEVMFVHGTPDSGQWRAWEMSAQLKGIQAHGTRRARRENVDSGTRVEVKNQWSLFVENFVCTFFFGVERGGALGMKEHSIKSSQCSQSPHLASPASDPRQRSWRLAEVTQHVCCRGCLAIGSWLPTTLHQRRSEGPGCYGYGAGLGPGELTDERLRFHRETSTDLHSENHQLRPTPATCKLWVGPHFATSRRIQSSPIRVVALSVGVTIRAEWTPEWCQWPIEPRGKRAALQR